MTALKFALVLVALVTFVAGQLWFKRAMEASQQFDFGGAFARRFIPGLVSMTVSFFLTLGLLQHLDLSYLYPFQGLSVIMICVLGALLLKERLTLQLLIGSFLISLGVVLVSLS